MKLDVSMLDELVREYCIYRGIVDSSLAPSPGESFVFPIFHIIFLKKKNIMLADSLSFLFLIILMNLFMISSI